ncbi:rho GTPase-activating protein 1-like isoform X3 [Malus sylvestris]|uniref:rho GTPase-activating protein 1-like isoform X3 n=1 Tax=Malus sylvestris TaxID=3752 RepID=UPI0021AD2610|nr:rho GTPase-activating protein 1-like isoform X3 [Malus sylvestris]
MTEVLHSPSHFSSSPRPCSSSSSSPPSNSSLSCAAPSSLSGAPRPTEDDDDCDSAATYCEAKDRDKRRREQLSLLALLVTFFRKSLIPCKSDRRELCAMEIGWPTNVRHVAHVTFDRFNGFLGLPVEFEPEVPRRPPSASTTVFGVSTESMQLSYDSRGNSVPTILLLMQGRLYAEGGLQVFTYSLHAFQAEGIFRINAENSQEEHVRDQLNRGDVPEGIDIHCLAGLIKAWFRELPAGVLDSLSPEQEHLNKMNARNIAMVFAPNMTQMADPLTALMYAAQVMNFLITLILKTLRERKDFVVEPPLCYVEPSDEDGHQSPSQSLKEGIGKLIEGKEQSVFTEEPRSGSSSNSNKVSGCCDDVVQDDSLVNEMEAGRVNNMTSEVQAHDFSKSAPGQSSDSNIKMVPKRPSEQQSVIRGTGPIQKARGISTLSRID